MAPWTGPLRESAGVICCPQQHPVFRGFEFCSEGSVQSLRDALKPDQVVCSELSMSDHDYVATDGLSPVSSGTVSGSGGPQPVVNDDIMSSQCSRDTKF